MIRRVRNYPTCLCDKLVCRGECCPPWDGAPKTHDQVVLGLCATIWDVARNLAADCVKLSAEIYDAICGPMECETSMTDKGLFVHGCRRREPPMKQPGRRASYVAMVCVAVVTGRAMVVRCAGRHTSEDT